MKPRALAAGDLVVIASLSGPLEPAYVPDLDRAVATLERMGFRVRRSPLLEPGRRRWWSAARPAEIAGELNRLLRDPDVRAIVAHDGGQTVLGYLDLVDVEAVVADPKPILGYSDISLAGLDAPPTLREIVLDVLGDRDLPVLGNVDFGHAGPNLPMPVGLRASLDAGERRLALLEPAVRRSDPGSPEI